MSQVTPEHVVEDLDAAFFVRVGQRQQFRHQIGMGADGALAEDDQVARQDVGAFDRDGDRHRAVQPAQPRIRAVAWYFMMPDTTAGFTSWFSAAQVRRRAASTI
ncbi:hypothetical protein G6F51_014525 [Rhizopus arrhizus]|uniref:Uncharacterized protein n=1 Tax=Rhizopus oryzae TaxID=64495 RepID=A0A9P7BZ14_RHIOR|nr:hypothetical protein G6F51_014525 [Rhizopus arrhizus]